MAYLDRIILTKELLPYKAPVKQVDFCLYIEPDREADAFKLVKLLAGEFDPCTINQTDYEALAFRPIVVSIETKRISGDEEEARVQIGVWQAAQWNMLGHLLAEQGLYESYGFIRSF